jgi:hypothetical protein
MSIHANLAVVGPLMHREAAIIPYTHCQPGFLIDQIFTPNLPHENFATPDVSFYVANSRFEK